MIAPDSFKGSVSAVIAAEAMAAGWASVRPGDAIVLRPMADGGEGTLDAFASDYGGSVRVRTEVTGPDGRPVSAEWLRLPDGTAVIELAAASGLHLLHPLLPLDAHTLGFGELIAAALDAGASRLILAIGGSASTDGGTGMLTALGARFLDDAGRPIELGNRGLANLDSIDVGQLRSVPAGSLALSDVTNVLLGPDGAASVFGPQKGATAAQVRELDANLERLVRVAGAAGVASISGSGAAGGTGFGLLRWDVPLVPGASKVGDLIGLPAAVASADLVITGEGRFDSQTASGKVAHYVATLARDAGVPAALIAGSIGAPTDAFTDACSLVDLAGSVDAAIGDPSRWIVAAAAQLAARFAARFASGQNSV